MNIQETFEKLCSEAKNERVKKTLEDIQDVCREQQSRGSKDFSVATIARLGENRGVPKAQSIRNKTGEMYRVLIKAWQDQNPKRLVPRTSSPLDWIERIDDPVIKYLVYDLASANKHLKAELQLCKSVTKLNIDMRQTSGSNDSPVAMLLESERDALYQAIDDAFLSKQGFARTSRGSIIDSKGRTVFKNGFVSGIQKLLSA